jgi:1-acyl-sn-glycerol-3-phosphate acyltransferase
MRVDCSVRPETTPAIRIGRAARFVVQSVVAWCGAVLVAPRLDAAGRARLVQRRAVRTLHGLRVDVVVRGARSSITGPLLVVANHVSWLDVYALNAVAGSRYVAKSEVETWPVAGAIARGFGTLFLRRGSFRDAARVKNAVADALRAGERVVVFPEGTTTDGAAVGRFHAAMLQAAVDAGAPVQAVAVRYRRADGTREPDAAFVGDMTFLASLRRVLGRPALRAELTFGPVLRSTGRTRRDLVRLTHGFVSLALVAPSVRIRPLRRAA